MKISGLGKFSTNLLIPRMPTCQFDFSTNSLLVFFYVDISTVYAYLAFAYEFWNLMHKIDKMDPF